MSLFEQVGSLLDYQVVRALAVPGINYLARRQKRGVYRISYDQGVWIHQTLHGYFAYPHPFIRLNLVDFDSFTRAVFFRAYCPKDGDVIVDIGAGAGEETLTFSRAVGEQGRVISVEAHPKTFCCLQKLIQYNRLRNVLAVHRAISEPACRVLHIQDSARYLRNRTGAGAGLTVPAITLDELIEKLSVPRIHFLKMNIEGAERLAIHGMKRTLERTQTVCICCHDFLADSTHDETLRTRKYIAQFLRKCGFDLIDHNGDAERPYVRDQVWGRNPALVVRATG